MDENPELLKKRNDLYLTIIMRYKNYIEEQESINVAELPKLIMPNDANVAAVSRSIKDKIASYEYEKDFAAAVNLAFEYISTITAMPLPIQFWQLPGETVSNKAGDLFDKAVLLCSILINLGGAGSKVMCIVKASERDFIVYDEYKEKVLAVNIDGGLSEFSSKEEMLKNLDIESGEDTSVYEFNDKAYINIA